MPATSSSRAANDPCVDVPGEVVAVLDEELAQLGVVDEPAWVGDLVPSRENGANKREPTRLPPG